MRQIELLAKVMAKEKEEKKEKAKEKVAKTTGTASKAKEEFPKNIGITIILDSSEPNGINGAQVMPALRYGRARAKETWAK